jgi:hypothetical protein
LPAAAVGDAIARHGLKVLRAFWATDAREGLWRLSWQARLQLGEPAVASFISWIVKRSRYQRQRSRSRLVHVTDFSSCRFWMCLRRAGVAVIFAIASHWVFDRRGVLAVALIDSSCMS